MLRLKLLLRGKLVTPPGKRAPFSWKGYTISHNAKSDSLRARLTACRLYLVTDSKPVRHDLDWFLATVLEAGVEMVQLREKQMEAAPLLRIAEIFRKRTEAAGALFIVNDRVDVAVAANADGVHLGQLDLPVGEARRQMGREKIIGLSTHSRRQLEAAMSSPADYCALGPLFATPTKPGRPAVGLDPLRTADGTQEKPVFAIGGIDTSNVASVLNAGAKRVSVVRALTEADDPAAVARALSKALSSVD